MTLDYSIHKNIQLQILKEIYTDTTIAPHLGFKGGTAALMFYDLNRYSVDLDFDLLDESKEKGVFEKILKIAKDYGEIRESRIKRFNLIIILSYNPKAQNIKIEINRRNFGSRYDLKSYMGISMLVMTKKDMFAHKLMAMHERLGKTNRDIYDVYFFAKNNWEVSKEIVKGRLGMTFEELVRKLISGLEKFNDRNVLDGLGELLTGKQKAWVKASLKKETLLSLKIMLESER